MYQSAPGSAILNICNRNQGIPLILNICNRNQGIPLIVK